MQTGTRIDRFELIEPLGAGGQASVWKARDLLSGELRALKVMRTETASSDQIERVRREGRALARLDHPSICRCFGLFEDLERGVLGLVLELVHGSSLASALSAGRLDGERKRRVAVEVAEALAHLHAKGLVHRDVKPANIVVSDALESAKGDPGAVKLVDLGIVMSSDASRSLTGPGHVIGTARYMAPEQIEPARWGEITAAADVFALGLTIAAMFGLEHPTGLPESAGLGDYAIAYRLAESTGLTCGATGEVATVVDRCVALDPRRRPTAAEVVSLLTGKAPPLTLPASPIDRFAPSSGLTEKKVAPYPHEATQAVRRPSSADAADATRPPRDRSMLIGMANRGPQPRTRQAVLGRARAVDVRRALGSTRRTCAESPLRRRAS